MNNHLSCLKSTCQDHCSNDRGAFSGAGYSEQEAALDFASLLMYPVPGPGKCFINTKLVVRGLVLTQRQFCQQAWHQPWLLVPCPLQHSLPPTDSGQCQETSDWHCQRGPARTHGLEKCKPAPTRSKAAFAATQRARLPWSAAARRGSPARTRCWLCCLPTARTSATFWWRSCWGWWCCLWSPGHRQSKKELKRTSHIGNAYPSNGIIQSS